MSIEPRAGDIGVSAPQITIVAKRNGPLTKRISLAADGSPRSDSSACVMSTGTAKRFEFRHVYHLAAVIEVAGGF